jgi:hypothetical protein
MMAPVGRRSDKGGGAICRGTGIVRHHFDIGVVSLFVKFVI